MSLAQWSTTAATNASAATGINWAEGQAPSTINDSARQMMADLRAEATISATVVAAGTTDLSTATGNMVPISGNTTITGLGTVSAGIERKLLFTGTPTIVHNGTSNILPGGATIVAAAGDVAHVISEGSGNWRWHDYVPAGASPYQSGSFTATLTGCTTSPTYTVFWIKQGKLVTLVLDPSVPATGTSNATTKTLTGVPANLWPAVAVNFYVTAQDNSGTLTIASANLSAAGVISMFKDVTGAAFTASGTFAAYLPTITYAQL